MKMKMEYEDEDAADFNHKSGFLFSAQRAQCTGNDSVGFNKPGCNLTLIFVISFIDGKAY